MRPERELGSGVRPKEVIGIVRSGIGDLAGWMVKLAALYERKVGRPMVPGSLNVELPFEFSMPPGCTRIEPGEDGCRVGVSIVPCRINSRKAFVVRTDAIEAGEGVHPKSIIEVISDVHLRSHFGLQDGDRVKIELDEPAWNG